MDFNKLRISTFVYVGGNVTQADVITLLREGVWITIQVASPVLLVGMAVGLVVSILQTTTSIQEQTLTFVPKLVATLLGLVFFASWMVQLLSDYTISLIEMIEKF